MKNCGHTKTLFIQGGKYKWSFKYEHCIKFGQTEKKHKGRGLCARCWERERDKDPKRREQKYNAGHKWHVINKPRKPREEWKKMGPKPTGFDGVKYKSEWYLQNRERILLLKKGITHKKQGLVHMQYRGIVLPFTIDPLPLRLDPAKYDAYKENMRKFDLIKNYLDKKEKSI